MSVMAEEAEREKPKFVCKLCKLDYPSSVQFEEHLWSMLHHKAINNKTSSTKHHCNLCMFESFDLNAYGKHLIGEQHKRSLVERRKRLEEPRQIKGTAPATSCSNRSDSQTAQGTNQKVKSTNWGPPTHTLPNQTSFYHGGYSQSQGPNSFQQAFKSNTDYDYEEQFIYNQGEWQNPHNPYSWHPPHGWFGQPSVGSWENKSPFNPRQRFQTPPPAVQQQYEKSIKRPGKPEAQGKVSKKKEGKNKAHWKNDNVTSTVKIRKASHHSVASKGLFAQGCHVQKPAHQHVPAEQALSDLVKRDIQSESVPYVKVARGPTPSKNQKKKKQKTPSPKIKPNGHPEQTGSTPKPSFKTKGKFAKKKIFLNALQNQSSATSHPSPMTQAVKESQFFSKPTQSSEIASTKQSAPSEDIASSTTTFPKATSAINRFEMTLCEALHEKDDVHGDEIVEVTSSDVAGVSGKAADHSATLLTSSSPMVSSSVAVTPFQFAQEQYTWEKEQSSPKAHSSSSLAADKWTFKIHHQKETIASRNKASVPETAAGLLPTLATSMSTTVSSATDAVSSFHSLHEQNGKWSAEIRCASSSDKLASKTHSHTETTSLGTSDTLASKIHSRTETSSLGTSDELASKIHSRTETSSTSMSDKPTSKIHSHTEKSSTGMSDKSTSNIHSHTESTGTSDKPTSNIHSHTESSSMGMSDKPTSNIQSHTESSSTGTSDKPTSNIHSHTESSSTGTSDKPTSNIHSHTESSSTGMSDKPTSKIHSHTESSSTGTSDKRTSNMHSRTESSSTGMSDKPTSNIHSHTEKSSTGISDKLTSSIHSHTESSSTGMSYKPTSNIHSHTGSSSPGMSDKPTSNIHSHTEKSSTGMSDKSTSNIHSHTESSSTGMSYKPTSNIHIHIESSSTGTSDKPTSNIHSRTESSSTSTSDKRASKMHSHTESSSTGTSDKPSSNIHSRTESSSTSTSDKPTSNIHNRTESSSTGTLPDKPTYITHFGTESSSTGTSDKPTSKTHSHTESSSTDTYVQNIGLSSSTGTPEDCSNLKELVKSKSEETGSDESSTSVSNFARSSSSPATLITVASQSKEFAGNQRLLSKVLINEQQKQKLNPRPNLTNARSRLRTNKDAEHPTGGQIFKEKIQGLLSDVAKPVWQQKKLRMMLAKAKKAPDRFNRFSHPASSPSRSEDPIESLDIMNLSTEFQQELLDLIQSEDADEEDILSQLTASEANETWEGNQQDFVGRSTPAESLKSSWRHGEVTLGGIQEAVPLMSQALHERSHTVPAATPVSIQQQGLQATLHPSHTVGSRSSTPVIKLERLDSTELMDSCVYQPSFGSEQLQDEGHSHPGLISSNESCAKPDERGSTERHQTVTSASPVFNQEPPTFADLDTQALQPSQPYTEQNHPGHFSPENPDDRPEEGGPTERHDASVTSTSTIPSMTVDPDSTEETEMITKVHKHKKKKSKKSKSKEKDPSTSKKVKKTSPQEKTPKLKESKSTSSRRNSVQSSLSVRVSRTKSPAVLTATKLKKKLKQKRNMLDTMVGDMSNLLEITLQENKLQAKMDKLTAKIDKVVEIIQEKEAMLKSFKQQKDMFMSSLGDLREKRLDLLLGLTSGEKSDSSPSVNERNGSRTDEGPSSSNTTRDLAPALPRGGLQTDRHQADSSDVAQSGGEGGIKISNVTSMASTTSIHRTEGFRIMFGSPTRPEGDQGHGLRDIFRDVGCNQDELGIAIGSPPMQSHASQSIEMVPQVMSRESLAKTLQELNSCGSGVTVDILSDEETLYGIGRERLMHPESLPPNSDVIEAVAQLVRGHVMSPDRDSVMQMSDVTVEPYQMAVGSDQGIVQRERTGEYGAQGSLSLRSDTEEGLSVMGLPNRNKTSYETTLKRIKQEPQDHHDIGQRQEALVQGEPSLAKRKRWKEVSEENQTKRPKHNRKDPIMSKIKHEVDTLLETTSSAYPPEHDNTTIPQMESTHNYQSKVTSAPFPLGSKDNNNDNPGESSTSLKEISEPSTTQQSAHQAGDASSQEKATSSPRSKGYVINMYIIVDKLYACISDSRFIIFNLTTNTIDAEEDLALRNIKYFELWRDTAASKMVAFVSDGSKNLVQFNVQGKEFLQTLVLGRDITCLHVKWNTLYAGLVNGDIASINIQKCKVSWYYDCTPSYAVTAISSTLEGGMALLITASEDRTVTIRRADDGLLLRSLGGHLDVVTHLQVLGCRVMSMARNSTILIHNLETGDLILRVKHQTKMACCVMSGDTLAMAGHTGNVYYYKIETGQADIFDSGCGNITCMTTSQDMLFLGIRDGFIDVIPLYPSKVYQCEWSHCISRFLRVDALKTHLQLIHIRRSARQCLWRSCLKNYPQKNTTVKVIEQHVFSHLKDLGNQ